MCHAPFNFDFERESLDQGVEMPKEELQRYVYLESIAIHHVENVDMGDDDDSSFLHSDAIHLH